MRKSHRRSHTPSGARIQRPNEPSRGHADPPGAQAKGPSACRPSPRLFSRSPSSRFTHRTPSPRYSSTHEALATLSGPRAGLRLRGLTDGLFADLVAWDSLEAARLASNTVREDPLFAACVEVTSLFTTLAWKVRGGHAENAIVEYLKPAHTHFVDLVEPLPPILPNHWELGLSDLGRRRTCTDRW